MYNYSFSFIFNIIKKLANKIIVCNIKTNKSNIISYIIIIYNTKASKSNIISYIIIIYNIKISKSNIVSYILTSAALFRNQIYYIIKK